MQWHRELTREDVDTARRLLDQHEPMREVWRGRERAACANALHMNAPVWPCDRAVWAGRVLDAERRGEVTDPPRLERSDGPAVSSQWGPTREPRDQPGQVAAQWWLRPSDVLAILTAHGLTEAPGVPMRTQPPPLLTPAELAAHVHDLADARGQAPTLNDNNRAQVQAVAALLLATLGVSAP